MSQVAGQHMVSYHGAHSNQFCSHAHDPLTGILDHYVRSGYTHVAVTEHLPSRSGQLYPEEEALGAEELARRFQHLFQFSRALIHKRYDGLFSDFRIGFETEFCGPDPPGYISEFFDLCHPEIIVASVHHVNDMWIDFERGPYEDAIGAFGDERALVSRYYDEQLQLIEFVAPYVVRVPVILGHMDVIKLYRRDPHIEASREISDRIRRNIRAAIKAGLVFEVNSRGFKKGVGQYPASDILRLISEYGGQITFGDDSHSVDDVGTYTLQAVAAARQYFSTYTIFHPSPNNHYQKEQVPL